MDHVESCQKYKFSVCSLHLYLVCILYPVCSLQSAFFTDRIGIAVFVRASLKSGQKYWSLKKILLRVSWPLWLMCGLYVEELLKKSTMIKQWLLCTNWRRTQIRGLPIWLPLMLFRVVTACVEMNPHGSPRCQHFGFSMQVAFLEVRNCDLTLLSLLNHKNNLFLSTWVSELHRN